jgi:hypothetical protein
MKLTMLLHLVLSIRIWGAYLHNFCLPHGIVLGHGDSFALMYINVDVYR